MVDTSPESGIPALNKASFVFSSTVVSSTVVSSSVSSNSVSSSGVAEDSLVRESCSYRKFFRGLALLLVMALLPLFSFAEGEQGNPHPAYDKVDVRDGVWNNGQAAFWDLHILDHYRYLGPEERVRGYRPEQPIKFSHVTHVQKNQMDCQYCHWSVGKAAYAAIPEVQTCMGCHLLIGGSTPEKKTEIDKVKAAWNENKPIEWVKVHVMPSHVHFNHKRHVKAGITCQSCHGQVPKMEVVERVSTMRMGWCVDCHRQKGASIDCYTCHY